MRRLIARRDALVRHGLVLGAAAIAFACSKDQAPVSTSSSSYLFVWAGDSAAKASDFLAVINADTASPEYGTVVTTLPTGEIGTNPHHTEAEMPADGHLLANGFGAGRTYLFDLTTPTSPKLLTSFGDRNGFSHPHTFVRLTNGHVLATFQYTADSSAAAPEHHHDGSKASADTGKAKSTPHRTGGLVEMDERGTVIRAASAMDTHISDTQLFPYSVLELAAADRAVSTTTDMDDKNLKATSEWVQFWRLSDLTLLKSIALPPGPRGDEHRLTGEPHLLADGKSVYIHTFMCGLYLVNGAQSETPTATFVWGFKGKYCGVPILTGHYWIQTVPEGPEVVVLDVADPAHPKQVSSISVSKDETPHWLAMDPSGRRLVLNSGGSKANRLFVLNFDPSSGALSIDRRFRDKNDSTPGIAFSGRNWPHGWTGVAYPHGAVFSR